MTTKKEVQKLITMPYPAKTSSSMGVSIFDACDNFFRHTPVRKILVVHDERGDYEYDEEMTPDKVIDISIENTKIYKQKIVGSKRCMLMLSSTP